MKTLIALYWLLAFAATFGSEGYTIRPVALEDNCGEIMDGVWRYTQGDPDNLIFDYNIDDTISNYEL